VCIGSRGALLRKRSSDTRINPSPRPRWTTAEADYVRGCAATDNESRARRNGRWDERHLVIGRLAPTYSVIKLCWLVKINTLQQGSSQRGGALSGGSE
jgi:hypothetical protein